MHVSDGFSHEDFHVKVRHQKTGASDDGCGTLGENATDLKRAIRYSSYLTICEEGAKRAVDQFPRFSGLHMLWGYFISRREYCNLSRDIV